MINKTALYKKIVELQTIHNNQNNACDYKRAIDEMWKEISKDAIQQKLGEEPTDSNKIKDQK